MNTTYLLIGFIALIALFYFMTIRPQRKQAEQQRQMHNSIQPGSRVMLTSGIYGTVTAMGDKQFVLELSPGVDITVLKQAIVRVVQPDDEEFAFDDAATPGTAAEDASDSFSNEAPDQVVIPSSVEDPDTAENNESGAHVDPTDTDPNSADTDRK
jgi:preprotein translocase subunit YajC